MLSSEALTPEDVVTPVDDISFSGEEVWGKYVDMHELHGMFRNLPHTHTQTPSDAFDVDYLHYLDAFTAFSKIPEAVKTRGKAYPAYLEALCAYLCGFISRIQPLVEQSKLEQEWVHAFEERWGENKIDGWSSVSSSSSSSSSSKLDLDEFQEVGQLAALGADRLKSALEHKGMKCGGTLDDRAARLWSVRGLADGQIPQKLLAKKAATLPAGGTGTGTGTGTGDDTESTGGLSSSSAVGRFSAHRQQLAWLEHRAAAAAELIHDIIGSTRRFVEKQSTRTAAEREQERLEEEQGLLPDLQDVGPDEDEDGEPIYNPKNLPLGWDGKPIPFWMYKLHGLNVEFKCEICGDDVYKGRRAYDRHFREGRHAHGMRILGIPNTKHFHDITRIDDAIALHEKMQTDQMNQLVQVDRVVEYEDAAGNVFRQE
jgi:splicing factor 3A subunit 3